MDSLYPNTTELAPESLPIPLSESPRVASPPMPEASGEQGLSARGTPLPRRWRLALTFYAFCSNALFSNAIWVVYLAAKGYSPLAIGLFEMTFHVAKLLAEVPTGVFADLVGRRASLIVSMGLYAASMLLFLDPTPVSMVASFALGGLSFAFRGGAEDALVWALAEHGGSPAQQTMRYSRLFSWVTLIALLATALGNGSGGFVSHAWSGLPFVATGVVVAVAILPLLFLPERRLQGTERPHPLAHAWAGLRVAWRDPVLLALLLTSALAGTVVTTIGFYTQLYLARLGYTLAAIGLVFAVSRVLDALATLGAPRLIAHVPARWLVPMAVGLLAAGLGAMSTGLALVGLVGFVLLFRIADDLLLPALSTYLNARAPEAQRATVLSLDTGLFSLGMIVLFPLFGLGLTHVSFEAVYRWTLVALIVGGLAIGTGLSLVRRRAQK